MLSVKMLLLLRNDVDLNRAFSSLSSSDPSGRRFSAFPERAAVRDGHGGGGEPDPARHGVQSGLSVHLLAERQTGNICSVTACVHRV